MRKNSLDPDPLQKHKYLSDIKHPSMFTLWKQSLAYLVSDITKKPRSFKIGVLTIILVCAFIVLLDSLMALAPLFMHNPTGDVDVTVMVRPPFSNILINGNKKHTKTREIDDLIAKSNAIRDNDIKKYHQITSLKESKQQQFSLRNTLKMFFENPGDFVTNFTEVERILLTSELTKDTTEGVYGRFMLP
jgi:hypothetical protein